jgi:predicted MPP superfamily phosphohydrolase
MSAVTRGLVGLTACGAAGLAYAVAEAHRYTLRRVNVPLGDTGGTPIKVLHISDLHLTPRHKGRVAWVQSLAALAPDLVVVTGDFLAHQQAVPVVMEALDPLLGIPGLFVLGSNDYYAPTPVQPWKYLRGPSAIDAGRPELPWGELVKSLTAVGWHDLSNTGSSVVVAGQHWDVRGVDDPHIERDRYDVVAGPFDPAADLRVGVTHAPYLRVLDALTADRADLILAGHTHGGQLCIPGRGALVTNCDLDTKRAKGLSRHPADDESGAYLHVSAGLGTSPYAPVRFACPPEATLLTLTGALR